MTILTTERLRLAPFDDAHLDGLNAINSDPEVMRYLGSPESREQTLEIIQRVKGRWIEYGFSWWSFIERATDQVVGAGCIQHLRRSGGIPGPRVPAGSGLAAAARPVAPGAGNRGGSYDGRLRLSDAGGGRALCSVPCRKYGLGFSDEEAGHAVSGNRNLVRQRLGNLRDDFERMATPTCWILALRHCDRFRFR